MERPFLIYNTVAEERPKGTRLEGRGKHDLEIAEQRLASNLQKKSEELIYAAL